MPPGFELFIERMERERIAVRSELRGCTSDEINALEARYGVTIPKSYHWYLSVMGHESGRLLTHDHYAATYEHVLELTSNYVACWSDSAHIALPSDALVIVGRLGEQFLMIRCNDSFDSPVWYFNEYETDMSMVFSTVLDWLNSMADEAESAIKTGYFDQYPNGTRP